MAGFEDLVSGANHLGFFFLSLILQALSPWERWIYEISCIVWILTPKKRSWFVNWTYSSWRPRLGCTASIKLFKFLLFLLRFGIDAGGNQTWNSNYLHVLLPQVALPPPLFSQTHYLREMKSRKIIWVTEEVSPKKIHLFRIPWKCCAEVKCNFGPVTSPPECI